MRLLGKIFVSVSESDNGQYILHTSDEDYGRNLGKVYSYSSLDETIEHIVYLLKEDLNASKRAKVLGDGSQTDVSKPGAE